MKFLDYLWLTGIRAIIHIQDCLRRNSTELKTLDAQLGHYPSYSPEY